MHPILLASLHQLGIALWVRRDDDHCQNTISVSLRPTHPQQHLPSAPNASHTSLSILIVSGLLPSFFVSNRIRRSLGIRLAIISKSTGPNVASMSEPIQMRNQLSSWTQVERTAPMPEPVQIAMPRR